MELRCVCLELSLRGLLSFARRQEITSFDALSRATGCGTRCGTCRPYIERMLASGEVPTADIVPRLPDSPWAPG
ncbi:MAG: bacterioferritin-associated ferredoxin [Phycisphaerae bacterium]